jgi:hypothetical protein
MGFLRWSYCSWEATGESANQNYERQGSELREEPKKKKDNRSVYLCYELRKLYKCMFRFFLFVTTCLLIINTSAICQDLISNDSIAFKVLRKRLVIEDDGSVIPSSFFLMVNLKNGKLNELRKLSKVDWLKLLSNEKTDWIANLVLYNLTKKDAVSFAYSAIKNRSEWVKSGKYEEDISYWKENLR